MGHGDEHDEPAWYAVPWRFFVESVIAISIFAVITSAAVGLSFIVRWLEEQKVDPVIVYGLKAAEYFLFAVDLYMFAYFWIKTARRTLNRM